MRTLSPLDFFFISAESLDTPMHVAGVQIFELPKGYRGNFVKGLVGDFLARRDVGPPFNYVLRPACLGLPYWETIDDVDLDYHVRHSALPKPGTMQDLWRLISQLSSQLLDRNRPLWEIHVIEGLANRRCAIYIKAHHAFMDGATAVRMSRGALSESPDETYVRGFWQPLQSEHADESSQPQRDSLTLIAEMIRSQLRTLPELFGLIARRGLQGSGMRPSRLAIPFTAPPTSFNTTVRAARRYMGVSISLTAMKMVGRTMGATVNEVLLTIIDMALNCYLRDRNELPDKPLVAAAPIDLRRKSGKGDEGSNIVAALLVNLGQPNATPADRLRQIHLSSSAAKEEARTLSSEALVNCTNLLALEVGLIYGLGLGREIPPPVNILISNVKGLDKTYYLKGARLLQTYPVPPLGPGMAITVITCSYVDSMDIGISSDRAAVPEPEKLARYVEKAFVELEQAASAAG
jgi:WS/DGAT/MGAT family acyltransferase